jgi:hypothetical protein
MAIRPFEKQNMSWNVLMGILSTLALFAPVAIIAIMRLYGHRSFIALFLYYLVATFYNLMTEDIIHFDPDFVLNFGIVANLLDAPLILLFLMYFSPSAAYSRRILALIVLFIVYEITIVAIFGMTKIAVTYFVGPGIFLILCVSLVFFIRQVRITIMHRRATGKALMISSILWAYGCFGVIYLIYYVLKTESNETSFLVFFIVSTFSSLMMSAGLIIEKNRIIKLKELKTTRKELSVIFGNNKAAHERAALLKRIIK